MQSEQYREMGYIQHGQRMDDDSILQTSQLLRISTCHAMHIINMLSIAMETDSKQIKNHISLCDLLRITYYTLDM